MSSSVIYIGSLCKIWTKISVSIWIQQVVTVWQRSSCQIWTHIYFLISNNPFNYCGIVSACLLPFLSTLGTPSVFTLTWICASVCWGPLFVYIHFLCHFKGLLFSRFLNISTFKLLGGAIKNILQEAIIYQWKTGFFFLNRYVLLNSFKVIKELIVTTLSLFFPSFLLAFPVTG